MIACDGKGIGVGETAAVADAVDAAGVEVGGEDAGLGDSWMVAEGVVVLPGLLFELQADAIEAIATKTTAVVIVATSRGDLYAISPA